MLDVFLSNALFLWAFSFWLSYSVMVFSIPWLRKIGLVDLDWFKAKEAWVPTGGVLLWLPFAFVGILLGSLAELKTAALLWTAFSILLGSVGTADDLGRKMRYRLGWMQRALPIALVSLAAAFFIAKPFSFFGLAHFSEPLLFIPLTALFIALLLSLENSFGGVNGWNGGASFFVTLGLAYLVKDTSFFLLAVAISGVVGGFAWLYKYPARVFPGDSQPYLTGSAIAIALVYAGRMDWGLLLYLPHLFDFFGLKVVFNKGDLSQKGTLKEGAKTKKVKGVKPFHLMADGRLAIPKYPDGVTRYDFGKFLIRFLGPKTEKDLMLLVWLAVALNALLVVLAFELLA